MGIKIKHRCLYLQQPGAVLGITAGEWVVRQGEEILQKLPCNYIDRICIFGGVQITSSAIAFCWESKTALHVLSQFGQYQGSFTGAENTLWKMRKKQFLLQEDTVKRQAFADTIISNKIRNSIAFLKQIKRNHPGEEHLTPYLIRLRNLRRQINSGLSVNEIIGVEGMAARYYFTAWGHCLHHEHFSFTRRKKHPASDPINGMLSLGYSLLLTRVEAALRIHGMDSSIGIVHASRNHPALACDLMEEFRTAIVESMVLKAVNSKRFVKSDFYYTDNPVTCFLTDEARKRFLILFEKKMETKRIHPDSRHPVTWEDIIELQAVLFKKYVTGVVPQYEPYKII